ncbi:MAG: hypothetical protein IKH47_06300, partial [Bacteroidaceae bacterium]|nr:hypothetical protein [Bacteroidaceae bacterium]
YAVVADLDKNQGLFSLEEGRLIVPCTYSAIVSSATDVDKCVDSTAKGSLDELIEEIRTAVDFSTLSAKYTSIAALEGVVEQCEAAVAADASTPAEYRALEAQLREAYSVVSKPVADVLDVVFNANGTATDASTMGNTINKKGTITVDDATNLNGNLAFDSQFNSYFLQTKNTWGQATAPGGYYVVDYASGRTTNNPKAPSMNAAITDGFTVECYFRSRINPTANVEAKLMGGTSGGGWAVLCATNSYGNKQGGELTFLVGTGTTANKWNFATSGINLEKDKYYHLVGIWDKANNVAKVYIDGEFKGQVTTTGPLFTKGDNFNWIGIGCGTISTGSAAAGSVVVRSGSEWDLGVSRIYDQPLSDYQVSLLWQDIETIRNRFITGYKYPDGYIVTEGAHFPVHGDGFAEGDVITLTSTEDASVCLSSPVVLTAKGAQIDIPAGFATGEYTVSVTRGTDVQTLGTSKLTMGTSMPKPSRVIAHRGWHTKGNNAAHNSRQSVRNAMEAGFYGCEIDVHQTTDGYLMINHDFGIGGVTINQSTYDQVKNKTIGNGEIIPQLSDLFDIMKNEYPDSPTKLVIELKTNQNTDTLRLANSVVQAVKDAGLQDRVEYISFGLTAGVYVRKADPTAIFSYLSTVDPSVLVTNDLQGADFGYTAFTGNPSLVERCDNLGLYTNGWTANDRGAIFKLNEVGVDFITTDYPDIAQEIYNFYKEMMPEGNISYSEQDETGTFSGTSMLTPEQYTSYVQTNKPAFIDLSGVKMSKEITLAILKQDMPANTIYKLPDNNVLFGDNLIKKGKCANLVITDGEPFYTPEDFTATATSYERNVEATTKYGTICLPFEVNSDSDVQYYYIDRIEDGTLCLTEVATLEAGTPAVFAKLTDNATTIGAQGSGTIKAGAVASATGLKLVGTFKKLYITDADSLDNIYYISQDKFYQATNSLTVAPFRAYFENNTGESSPIFDIALSDDMTGIRNKELDTNGQWPMTNDQSAYDLQGRKIGALRKGINILRSANGETKKIIVK